MTVRRRWLAGFAALAWLVAASAGSVIAADPTAPPAGPPYPEPVDGQAVYDFAGVFDPSTVEYAEQIVDAIEAQTRAEIVVYTQALGRDDITTEEAEQHAAALMDEWGVGRAGINDGLVILFDLDTSLEHGQVQLYAGSGFAVSYLSQDRLQAIFEEEMLPLLEEGDLDSAMLVALGQIVTATFEPSTTGEPGGVPATAGPPPGPPFPDPETERAV